MMANRRNLIFRVSIVINIAVLLYAAMQLSGNNLNNSWDEPDRAFDLRYLTLTRPDGKNDSNVKFVRFYDELTSQNSPTTMATVTNKTTSTSSTVSMVEVLKKLEVLKKVEELNMTLSQNESVIDRVDENELSNTTLSKLADLLGCHQRDFEKRLVQRGEFWVMQNFVQADHGQIECHESVTYTTHAGFEFLDNIPPLVERWMGPISIAIHAPGTDFQRSLNAIRYLRECLNHDYVKQFVTFHIFFSNKHIPDKIPESYDFLNHHYECPSEPPYVVGTSANNASYKKKKGLLYPVNVARNVARDAALTHFILPSDIELYPSPNIIARFLNMIARNEKPLNTSTKPRVFPISIFEVDAKNRVPLSKTELQAMLKNKSAIPFHKFVCSNCHNIPQGIQWMKAAETKQMGVFHIGKRKGRFVHWEPIFIGTHQDPYYDERLSWEGKQDKMTQGYILCVKDYDFMILNNAFLTHKPGIKHYAKDPKRDSIAGKQSSFNKNVVIPELKKLFGYRQGCGL